MSKLGKLYRYVDYWNDNGMSRKPAVRCEDFEILRKTEKGCWIAINMMEEKFVLDEARKKFAYHTKKAALTSFICRKNAQIRIVSDQLEKAQGASVIAQRMVNGGKEKSLYKGEYGKMRNIRVPVSPPLPPPSFTPDEIPIMMPAQAPIDMVDFSPTSIDPATREHRERDRVMEEYLELLRNSSADLPVDYDNYEQHRSEHEARERQRAEAVRPVLQEGALGRLSASLRSMRSHRVEALTPAPSPVSEAGGEPTDL